MVGTRFFASAPPRLPDPHCTDVPSARSNVLRVSAVRFSTPRLKIASGLADAINRVPTPMQAVSAGLQPDAEELRREGCGGFCGGLQTHRD